MVWPNFVVKHTLTAGESYALEDGEPLKTRLTVTASNSLVWDATGEVFAVRERKATSELGEPVAIELPVTDQPGWRDDKNNLIDVTEPDTHTHTYKVVKELIDGNGRVVKGSQRAYLGVVIPTGINPIDLDLLLPAETVEGAKVSIPDSWSETLAEASQVVADAAGFASAAQTAAGQAATSAAEALEAVAPVAEQVGEVEGTVTDLENLTTAGRLGEDALSATIAEQTVARRVHILGVLGQSNARGQGLPYSAAQNPSHPRVFQVPAVGAQALTIVPATDPLVMHDYPAAVTGIGPAFQFARQWMKDIPEDDVIVIVGAAHGGTILSGTGSLAWKWGISGGLAEQAVAQLEAAFSEAADIWPNAKVSLDAILWVQGEQDGTTNGGTGTPPATYQADLDALIAGLRTTFEDDRLPFILGSMAPEYFATGAVAAINTVHAGTPYRVPFTGYALGAYGYVNADNLHISDLGQRRAGKLLYEEFQRVRNGLTPVYPASGVPAPPSDGYEPFNGTAISDTFTRTAADVVGTAANSGQPWEGVGGRFAVDGSRLVRHASLGGTTNRIKSTAIGDMGFSAVCKHQSLTGTSITTRLYFSHQAETDGIRIQISVGSTGVVTCTLLLYKANVATTLATFPAGTIPNNTAAADYAVSALKDGLNITATINGQTVAATLTEEQNTGIAQTGQYFAVSTTAPLGGFELDNLIVTVKGKRPIAV